MKHGFLGSIALLISLSTTAWAADLPVKAPLDPGLAVAAPASWQGIYVGGHVGYGWGSTRITELVPYAFCNTGDPCRLRYDFSGPLGGAQIGFNVQSGPLVFGAEADVSWSGMRRTIQNPFGPVVANESFSTKMDWFGTGRARLGYASSSWLPYVTGGFAFARIENRYTDPPDSAVGSGTKWGWTVGGGVEYALQSNWSVRAEYLYVDLKNTHGVLLNVFRYEWENHFHVARVGLNYRFGGSPVIARY
jgi:outer membrane immunogenic protein